MLYRTATGTIVGSSPGKKSSLDFRVWYESPGKRRRTPKHIHLIVDLYAKLVGNRHVTLLLRDHMLDVSQKVVAVEAYPPALQVFRLRDISTFAPLDAFGEYTVEFLLVTAELIMIQEKTNYPGGHLNRDMWMAFGKEDIFTVVSIATFRGRPGA